MYRILVMNLGGTSTKLAIFEDKQCVVDYSCKHSLEEMEKNPLSVDQVAYRKEIILNWLSENGFSMDDFDALAVRCTPIKEVRDGGTYEIAGTYREKVLAHYHPDQVPEHGTRISVPIAEELIGERKIPMYVTDPGSVNELSEIARISGIKDYPYTSSFHALNQRATARKYAESVGKAYQDCRLIVAHLGAGISVGAHVNGRICDVNNAGYGTGPFTPQRAGTVETGTLISLCFDKGLTKKEVQRIVRGDAGVLSHLGTDDMREVEARIASGDRYAELVFNAMAYQIAKAIGAEAAVLQGQVDAILITGGIAHSNKLVDEISSYVKAFAPVIAFPGEFENEALALGAYRVMSGEEAPQQL